VKLTIAQTSSSWSLSSSSSSSLQAIHCGTATSTEQLGRVVSVEVELMTDHFSVRSTGHRWSNESLTRRLSLSTPIWGSKGQRSKSRWTKNSVGVGFALLWVLAFSNYSRVVTVWRLGNNKWHFVGVYVCVIQETRRRDSLRARPAELFMCSVLERQGCADAFRWLADYLNWISITLHALIHDIGWDAVPGSGQNDKLYLYRFQF